MQGLFVKDIVLPQVIVIDRDLTLMNALECIFPSSTNLLCQFHIAKNVKAKCNMQVKNEEDSHKVLDAWNGLVQSLNEHLYEQRLTCFENMYSHYPLSLEYVKSTWLVSHKEKFVTTWIDQVMHLETQ